MLYAERYAFEYAAAPATSLRGPWRRLKSIVIGSLIFVTHAERETFGKNREKASLCPLSAISTFAFSALICELSDFAISKASCSVSGAAMAATLREAI